MAFDLYSFVDGMDYNICEYYDNGKCYANSEKPCFCEKNKISYERCSLRRTNLNMIKILAERFCN